MADDVNWKNAIFRASSAPFSNSKCLFIEYYDCVHFTGFSLVNALRATNRDIFGIDFDEISLMDTPDLLRWYCRRRNRNPLIDLWEESHPGDEIPHLELNNFYDDQLTSSSLHRAHAESNIVPIAQHLLASGLVKDVVVYVEGDTCDGIRENVSGFFGESAKIVAGDFIKALESVPGDTTYALSDVEKVLTLAECGKLDFVSIIIPENFRYNVNEDGMLVVDLATLATSYHFKVAKIDLCGI